jgi:SAM-dependent methyltransferase
VANAEQAAAWDGEQGDKWVRFQDQFDRALVHHGEAVLAAAALAPGDRVLDIGCGCGHLTRVAARTVTPTGRATGVDLSAVMLARAREMAASEELGNVEFVQADAQTADWGPVPYDVAVSRFGVMFFDDAPAAFTNIARGLAPGGRLAVIVWQPLARNEWQRIVRDALLGGRDLPEPSSGVPGPYGLSDPDDVRAALHDGFVDVDIAELASPIHTGTDLDEATAFATRTGIGVALLRDLDEDQRRSGLEQLRGMIAGYVRPDSVVLESRAWLVTARRAPG